METAIPSHARYVFVCVNERPPGSGPSCGAAEGPSIAVALKTAIQNAGLSDRIRVSRTHCLGACKDGPNVLVFPDHIHFKRVDLSSLPVILEKLGVTT